MESRIAQALRTKYPPVALLWSDQKPADARQFVPGKWGCVMMAFAGVVQTGKPQVFDRATYGCWGGGVGLGFGNCYEQFPGGVEGFCGFLSDGNVGTDKGRAVAEACAGWMTGSLREDFLHGERFRKTPGHVAAWVQDVPMTDIPAPYAIFKRFDTLAEGETPVAVVFLANADQLSALVVLANYARGDSENAIIPHAAGCQSLGIFTYREAGREKPRAVVGLNDISARHYVRRLGKDLVTVSLPWQLYLEMEQNVPGSFLEKEPWTLLAKE